MKFAVHDLPVYLRVLLLAATLAPSIGAYSVLTHEALIDSAWDDTIKPLLLKRFPSATEDDLRRAHGHAYGGAIVHDMGYYPLGSEFFSDLLHYVRAGDFVEALVAEARDVNELAFAIGAVAHFNADRLGHGVAVNRAVAMMYPKLARRYGDAIPYEKARGEHIKVEFGFDVAQVAKGRYAPEAYRDFIGFFVAKDLLERAFSKTYGLKLGDVLPAVDLAIGTFRFSVAQVIPTMTKAAWSAKEDEIVKASPGITRDRFLYNLSRASYQSEWGTDYRRPGWFARFLGFLFRALPKVGPLRAFAFRPPTPEAEKLFMLSFNETIAAYRSHVRGLDALNLPNVNLDTGTAVRPGSYSLSDKTHRKLMEKIGGAYMGADLRAYLRGYFGD